MSNASEVKLVVDKANPNKAVALWRGNSTPFTIIKSVAGDKVTYTLYSSFTSGRSMQPYHFTNSAKLITFIGDACKHFSNIRELNESCKNN